MAIFLSLLITVSTTGIVVVHHVCGCMMQAGISLPDSHCQHPCCSAQPADRGAGQDHSCCSNHQSGLCPSHSGSHCHDEIIYIHNPFISLPPVKEVQVDQPQPDPSCSFSVDLHIPGLSPEKECDDCPGGEPPPRSGSDRVIAFHTLKIPSPEAQV